MKDGSMLNQRIWARMWDTRIRPLRKLTNHKKANRLPNLAVLCLLVNSWLRCNMLKLPPRATLAQSIFNSTKLPQPEV